MFELPRDDAEGVEGRSLQCTNAEISQPCAAPSMIPGRSNSWMLAPLY